jgi:predicted P-loop ATPase
LLSDGAVIGICNELAGVGKADLEVLKTLITDREIAVRRMYQNGTTRSYNRMSFIGTTNESLGTRIEDPTGMRRFVPFECDGMSKDAVNAIDYLEAWRCINENSSAPVLEVADYFRKLQAKNTVGDPFEEFFAEYCLAPGTHRVKAADIYDVWKAFCAAQSLRPATQLKWVLQMQSRGFVKKERERLPGQPGQFSTLGISGGNIWVASEKAVETKPD